MKAVTDQMVARAELAYSQGLWYAWGRLDSGTYVSPIREKLDAFKFAEKVKANQLAFDTEQTHFNGAIQGQWEEFVAETINPEGL